MKIKARTWSLMVLCSSSRKKNWDSGTLLITHYVECYEKVWLRAPINPAIRGC